MKTPDNLHMARNRARAAAVCAWLAALLASLCVSAIDQHIEDQEWIGGRDEPGVEGSQEPFRWSDARAAGYQAGYQDALHDHGPREA